MSQSFSALLESARRTWPGIEVAPEAFSAWLAERQPAQRTDELYLTCACAHGDARACAAFEARYFPIAIAALRRMRLDPPRVDELRQRLRAELLAGGRDGRPRIADYAGRGELGSWLRITAVRLALQLLRSEQREQPAEDDRLAELSAEAGDADLRFAKRLYQPMFKEAFAAALDALPARDKNLLRQYHLDGLTVEELATLYRTHRTTATRWLAAIRQRVLDGTRRELMQRIRGSQAECDSIIRLVQSQLDLTLSQLLT
jgi:RNA polymerase sigma-70 factor (ECF subfamily)